MENNKIELDDTFIKMTQKAKLENAYLNSCKPRSQRIKGECYVSKDPSRKEKISKARQAILGLAAVAVIGVGVKVGGDIDAASEIRSEVTKQETTFNPIGGSYEKDFAYDEGFVDAMIDLNDGSLVKLFNDTSKEMIEEGYKEEAKMVSEVVEEMEENYLEEHGKTM